MFAYLKYFFLGSLILIVTASTFFIMLYKGSVHEVLLNQNIKNNQAIMQGFENTVFLKHAENIAALETLEADERSNYKEYREVFEDMGKYFENMPVVSAGFYTDKQELIFFYPFKEGKELQITKNIRNKRVLGLAEPIDFKKPQNEVIADVEYFDKSGNRKFGSVLHSIAPILDENNNPLGAVEIFVGVSEVSDALNNLQYFGGLFIILVFVILLSALYWIVRRAEKIIAKQYDVNMELQSAKVAAESENEQKSQFLANISHELRTPLNAIIGFSEIMKDEVLGAIGNQQYKNYVMDIHSQGVHLLSLINDILDFSKAEAGKLDLEMEELDLNKLVKTSMRTQEPRAQTAEVLLLEDLPSKHIVINSDAKRLKQILLNLMSNAVKFTPPGGSVKVSAWESVTDGNICIEVLDTGIGIAAKDISKALAPFGQVDSELSRRYEGTGLGLPLTKKFIELLGGTMNLESEVGKGTKITVVLPRGKNLNIADDSELDENNTGINASEDNFESFQPPKMFFSEDSSENPENKTE